MIRSKINGDFLIQRLYLTIIISVFSIIFLLDYVLPSEIAIGMLYVLPVFVSIFLFSRKTYLFFCSTVAISLIIIDFFLSKQPEIFWQNISNRGLSIGVVLFSSFIGSLYLKSQQKSLVLETKFILAMESAPNGMVVTDESGKILLVNQQTEQLFAYTRNELIGQPLEIFLSNQSQKRYLNYQKKFLTESALEVGESQDLYGRRQDGNNFPIEIGFNFLNTDEDKLIINSIIDITKRKELEAQLREKSEMLEYILEETGDGWWDWNLTNTEEKYLSPRFKALLGYQDKELPNTLSSWQKIIYLDDLEIVKENLSKHLEMDGQYPYWQEVRYLHKDGSTIWVICQGKAYKNKEGEFYHLVGTHTNITYLKNLEIELKKKNQELEDFAFIISHDLKTPIRGIGCVVDWLYEDYHNKLDDKGESYLDTIKNRVERMNNLIDGVLRYSRIEFVQEEYEEVDLQLLVKFVIESLNPPDNIEIIVDDPLPVLNCSRIRIEQIFQNLLSNAIRYMNKEHGYVYIHYEDEGDNWHFTIQDNGLGIASSNFEKIFKIFQTLAPRDKIESTGIGLTIVKKNIELQGGRVWLESCLGQGSTFHFLLPKKT